MKALVHALAVIVVLADVAVGVIDVLTIAAAFVAIATLGVYIPKRKEI